MSTPELKRLKERISELSQLVTTANGEKFEEAIRELQRVLHEHAEETRRVMLSEGLNRNGEANG